MRKKVALELGSYLPCMGCTPDCTHFMLMRALKPSLSHHVRRAVSKVRVWTVQPLVKEGVLQIIMRLHTNSVHFTCTTVCQSQSNFFYVVYIAIKHLGACMYSCPRVVSLHFFKFQRYIGTTNIQLREHGLPLMSRPRSIFVTFHTTDLNKSYLTLSGELFRPLPYGASLV